MANKWTPQQEQAIRLHHRNLLVSAAAGSGKTAVLVERIIQMITAEDGVDVDRLLVLTFTRAAAMEMKERIAARIHQMLLENPEHTGLKKQAALLPHASITTIDSFCLRIVRDYFGELDLDPDFRIGEEGELTLLQADCMNQLLEQYYQEGRKEFLDFAEAYGGGKSDYRLEEYIKKVYQFAQSCPYPEDWLLDAGKSFQVETEEEMENLPFLIFLKEQYRMLFRELLEAAEELLLICQEPDGPYAYEDMMVSDCEIIRRFLKAESFAQMCEAASGIKFVRKTTKRQKEADEGKKLKVSLGRDQIKEHIKKTADSLKELNQKELLSTLQAVRAPMEMLLELADAFAALYREMKAEKNILDFNDIEHLALTILVNRETGRTEAAKELQQQFAEILVDEYQDSNYLQDMILESISGKEDGHPNMFMVGDVKQSIYRFRMARPEIFMDRYRTYQKEESLYQKIDLQKNFRSREEVLTGINQLFCRIMTEKLGDVEYDEDAALYPGAAYPPLEPQKHEFAQQMHITDENHPALKLVLVDMDKKNIQNYLKEHELESNLEGTEAEAHAAAAEIKKILDPENGQLILDKASGRYRKASYRDIVILLRSISGKAEQYLDVLTAEGIPACAPASGYFDALEVQIMLSLLQIIDNPLQDIPLAAVLKSPFADFGADELAEILAAYKKAGQTAEKGLYPAMCYYAEKFPDTFLSEKVSGFLNRIERYRDKSRYLQVYELIQYLYEDTGYYDYVSAMPAGMVRKMNLDMLVEKAVSYEKTSYHGLFHFVRYMEHLKKYEVDFDQGQAFGEQDDIVRIYSIHKSKGLEYPIVILGGMARAFNQMDSKSGILLHPELGIAADYIDVEMRCKTASAASAAVAQRLKYDTLGEELRILYVAMTRAREKLIMIGADSRLQKRMETYAEVIWEDKALPFYRISAAGCYLDWVLMAVGDRLNYLLDVSIVSGASLFAQPAVKQAQTLSCLDELRVIAKESNRKEKVHDEAMHRMVKVIDSDHYAYEESIAIQSKFSVSELKRMAMGTEEEKTEEIEMLLPELHQVPAFMQDEEESIRGTSRGNSYHRVLELLEPVNTAHTEQIKAQLELFLAKGRIRTEDIEAVNLWKLYAFFKSETGQRMKLAYQRGKLHREQQFIMEVPAYSLKEEWKSDEPVLIQGVIDAWFEEGDCIILLDYKTDGRVTEEELTARYHRQFELYAAALEQITGKQVTEAYLWSFSLGKAISMK